MAHRLTFHLINHPRQIKKKKARHSWKYNDKFISMFFYGFLSRDTPVLVDNGRLLFISCKLKTTSQGTIGTDVFRDLGDLMIILEVKRESRIWWFQNCMSGHTCILLIISTFIFLKMSNWIYHWLLFYIYSPKHSSWAWFDTRSVFKLCLTGLNFKISFS